MSTTPPSAERSGLAAEHALRLLEGDDLAEAQRLERVDPNFAAAVAALQARLAPLFDEVAEATPEGSVWQRIRTSIGAANDNVAILNRKLRLWRGFGIAASAVAASLALFLGFAGIGFEGAPERPAPQAAQRERAPVLVATLASDDADASLSVTYDGERSIMLVSPGRLNGVPRRDHELWIIPAGRQPISLGLVRAGEPQRLPVRPDLTQHFQQRAAIALSVEPAGGSPTGAPTGPVIASGELLSV
jgi:anti-sigma-K factor RskA